MKKIDEIKELESIDLSPVYPNLECEKLPMYIPEFERINFFALAYFPDPNTFVRKTAIMLSIYIQYHVVLVV